MKSKLIQSLCRQMYPDDRKALLLGAALLDTDDAVTCWNTWSSIYDIEDSTWEEHKIFARLAGRLANIAPDSPFRPRLEGLAKAHWTHSQLVLHMSARALDIISDAGISVMLLKGGALKAAMVAAEGPRISSDLDIMVRREDFPKALKMLHDAGWKSKDSLEYCCASQRFSPGVGLKFKTHGNIDIHHQPVHGGIVSDDILNAFWTRAKEGNYLGRTVLIPSREDLLVIAAAHASRSRRDGDSAAAWVFDMALLAPHPDLNPEKLAQYALEFQALPATLAAISYLDSLIADSSVKKLLNKLAQNRSELSSWLKFTLETAPQPYGKLLRSLARRLLYWSGKEESKRKVVPRLHPHYLASHKAHHILHNAGDDRVVRQELPLPQGIGRTKLVLDLIFDPPSAQRYQFDISADGKAIYRLSARVSKVKRDVIKRFVIPLPNNNVSTLAIESLSRITPVPTNSKTEIESTLPVPFAILRLSCM